MRGITHLSREAARRFAIRATGLGGRSTGIGAVVERLGYVQMDPLNMCGRMHDLILRNRLEGYREGALTDYMHRQPRPGVEHYLPGAGILTALPWSAWPFLLPVMQERKKARKSHAALSAAERVVADRIRERIRAGGPVTSEDFVDMGRGMTAWGTSGRLAKTVMEKLYANGEILICERRQFRRVYDLTENVVPQELQQSPLPPAAELERWKALVKLRQRRLVILKKEELKRVQDLVQPLEVEGCPTLHCLREDLPLLEETLEASAPESTLLLAPLDPLVYDRKLTRFLWDFDYTWEVYTPAHKRVRGYYALPVLSRGELVGHVEPKVDKASGELKVLSKQIKRGHKVAQALEGLGGMLGVG